MWYVCTFSDGDGSDAGRDSDDSDRDEQDILAKQARERDQSAVDVTGAVLGAIVRLLAKEIVRDAVGSAAPSKVKAENILSHFGYIQLAACEYARDCAPCSILYVWHQLDC